MNFFYLYMSARYVPAQCTCRYHDGGWFMDNQERSFVHCRSACNRSCETLLRQYNAGQGTMFT